MNILQINYSYPPSFSGCGRQLATVNRTYIQIFDDKLTVYTAYSTKGQEYSEKINSLFPFLRPKGRLQVVCYYIYCLTVFLYILVNARRIDVIHVISASTEALAASLAAKLIRKPFIVKVTLDEPARYIANPTFLRRKTFKELMKVANFVAISDKIRVDLLTVGVAENRIFRINNAVDKDLFEYPNVHSAKVSDVFKLVFVGAVNERKGIKDLFGALALIDDIKLKVDIVGPVELSGEVISELLKSLNAKANLQVQIVGLVHSPINHIVDSDCLILPSYAEGMPNVVIEAFSLGRPVIASDIEVHKEMISDVNGCIFPLGNIEKMAEVIKHVAGSQFNYQAIRNFAQSQYSSLEISNSYHRLYSEVYRSHNV